MSRYMTRSGPTDPVKMAKAIVYSEKLSWSYTDYKTLALAFLRLNGEKNVDSTSGTVCVSSLYKGAEGRCAKCDAAGQEAHSEETKG